MAYIHQIDDIAAMGVMHHNAFSIFKLLLLLADFSAFLEGLDILFSYVDLALRVPTCQLCYCQQHGNDYAAPTLAGMLNPILR